MRLAVASALVLALAAGADALDPGEFVAGMRERYAGVASYVARFVRQEQVDGILRPREEALLKFQRPGRLYLRWVDGPPRGREILFVPGRDGDQVLIHEPRGLGRLFTVTLPPDAPRVLEQSRHPITDIGIGRLVELLADNLARAAAQRDLRLSDLGVAEEGGRVRRRTELRFAGGQSAGYYASRVVVAVDERFGLPTGVIAFDADDRLVALYDYRDVRLNVELDSRAFDPTNPEYGFPRWRVPL